MVYNQIFRFSFQRSCILFAALHLSFSLYSQQILPDTIALKTVVIQSTRASDNHPAPHSNFSAEKIGQSYQAQDIPMLLSSVPSLVENSDAGAGVGYTGLRIRGSDPTRVNVTINGVPFNDAESQGVFWVNMPDIAASAAEIQVQRGVGTSSNGAGAFGATVNIDLSKVVPDPFAIVSNTFGSFATRKHSAYLGTGLIGGKMAFTGRISTIQSDGYIDRANSDLNSFHLTGAYIDDKQSFQAHILSGHERTYQAWYGLPAQYLDTLRTYNPAGTERAGDPYPDEVDDYTQRHFLAHYKYEFKNAWSLQLNGHYTRGFGFYEQYKAAESADDYGLSGWALSGDSSIEVSDLVRRRWLDNHFYGGTFALQWELKSAWKPVFLLGGAISQYEGRHFGELIWAQNAPAAPKDFVYYDNNATKSDANVFLKWESRPTVRLNTFIDLQMRRVAYQFLGFNNDLENVSQNADLLFFNPKIGATYSFSNKWILAGFAGIAHREPNRDDYTQSSPNSRPRAERMLDLEASLRGTGKYWSVSTNLYFMGYRDQLVLDGRLNDVGAYIRTNVPESYRAGLELEASLQIGRFFALNGNAAFSRNKVKNFIEYRDNWDESTQERIEYRNTNLAFSPDATARLEASWAVLQQTRHDLSVSLSGKYVGKQFLDNTSNENTILPKYFFSDLRLNYDLKNVVGDRISLILSVNNLFNKKYVANGWTYRYVSAGYNPVSDDPYTRAEGNDVYHQAGFFPQAGRYWMGTVVVKL
ncbi:MAG: TonB-dependent receptor [Lewinellaceae bacterium]|nr:TonB-dependent receptor [Lewinellaceae bacterium]